MSINNIFDIRSAITGLYLWLLFGFLSNMVSCDMQRLMIDNVFFRHMIGIIAFFFLFIILEKEKNNNIGFIWKKTIIIYFIFLLMTKSKWYYSIPVLLILVIDQSIKFHIDYLTDLKDPINKESNDKSIKQYEMFRDILYKLLITLIISGFIHYGIRQYNQYGDEFTFNKLLFTSKCKT